MVRDGGARPIDPAALDAALRPGGTRSVRYAFRYDSPPADLCLRLSPAASLLNAEVITVVSVRDAAVAYISQVVFEIRQAGRSQFQLTTPGWLGDDIEVRGQHIRHVRSSISDDRRTWEGQLQQPGRGSYRLELVQVLPLMDEGTVAAAIIRPLDADRWRGYIVLENLTADENEASTNWGAAPVPITEVPAGMAEELPRQADAAVRHGEDVAAVALQLFTPM